MDFHNVLIEVSLVILLFMTAVFIVSVMRKDNSVADIAWGTGFIIIGFYTLMQSGVIDLRKIIVNLLVLIWGLRLSIHILNRNKGKEEDFRYKAWRDSWRYFYLRSYLQVYMLQGLIMMIVSAPVWFINSSEGGPLGAWDSIGLILFGAGFLLEAFADYQLSAFKADPANKGKIMTLGVWAVSRHPNHFGEALVWWGIGFYTLSFPYGWATLAGPVVITLMLRFVSGVPMLEKRYAGRPDWEAYKAKTAPFVPFVKFL